MKRFVALSALFALLSAPTVVSAQEPDEEPVEEEEVEEETEDEETEDEETEDEETEQEGTEDEETEETKREETETDEEEQEGEDEDEKDLEVTVEQKDGDDDEDDDEEDDEEAEKEAEQKVVVEEPTDEDEEGDGQLARFGIVGGPSFSFISADEDSFQQASDLIVRYSAGLHGEYTVYRALGFAIEALFARRGWDTEGTVGGQEIDSTYEFSYLDVPVLLQFAVPVAERVAPRLMVGPHGSLFIDGSRGENTNDPFIDDNARADINREDVNELQFGLTAALGIEFNLTQGALTFDARYMHNFTEVFDDPLNGEDNVHHRSFLAMFGFLY